MVPVIRFTIFVMVTLTLPRPASLCEERDKPLLLSPYLDKNQVEKARLLSKVDKDCLEDFVPESHSGFITVDKVLGNHLFFWFFPHSTDENAPLLLWLNGGPTVSSMHGLFWENGPMEVIEKGNWVHGCKEKQEESESGYVKRQYPWTNSFSMLYVDNPAGVGFSFSDSGEKGYRFTEEGYTKDLVAFLKQFFKLFPEYKTRDLYLGGQSYAGKYIGALAYDIHIQIQEGRSDFNLIGIYLGAPFYDPHTQHEAFYDFLYAMGAISYRSMLDSKMACRKFYELDLGEQEQISKSDMNKYAYNVTMDFDNGGSQDNIVTREVAGYDVIAALLKRSKIKRAIHVGDRDFVGFENKPYMFKFARDVMLVSTKSKMAELMNNYKVLIYNGDFDISVSTLMIEAALLTTPWALQREYNDSRKSTWRRHEKEVIGYYSLTGNFCRVLVRGAGHQVPHEKPELSYIMMQHFIYRGCVSDIFSRMMSVSPSLATPSSLSLLTVSVIALAKILI